MMTTLYDKGDRVRARSITSEMPAVIVKGDFDGINHRVLCSADTVPAVVVQYIYGVGTPHEKLGIEITIPRTHVIRREADDNTASYAAIRVDRLRRAGKPEPSEARARRSAIASTRIANDSNMDETKR